MLASLGSLRLSCPPFPFPSLLLRGPCCCLPAAARAPRLAPARIFRVTAARNLYPSGCGSTPAGTCLAPQTSGRLPLPAAAVLARCPQSHSLPQVLPAVAFAPRRLAAWAAGFGFGPLPLLPLLIPEYRGRCAVRVKDLHARPAFGPLCAAGVASRPGSLAGRLPPGSAPPRKCPETPLSFSQRPGA